MILLSTIDIKLTVFLIVGGLGILLFGIFLLSDSLKSLAGSKLKLFLEKTTNTPLKGILVGFLMTTLIQSSGATSALVIGLVSAGLIGLPQAIGVIFGANIGTTTSSLLISLNLGDYALPIIFVGSFLVFFIKKKKVEHLGKVFIGFGMLFLGLELLSAGFDPLIQTPAFSSFLQTVGEKPILGFLVGIVSTAAVQSSSAIVGILQQIYTSGSVPLVGAIAIVIGSNIGTTITTVIASIGANSSAKKTALVHVLFNVFGSILFLLLIQPYSQFIIWLSSLFGVDYLASKFTISLSHIMFNIITVFVLFWFINQMVWLVNKIIPTTDIFFNDDVTLDRLLVKKSPDLALENAKRAIYNMGHVAQAMLEFLYSYAFNQTEKALEFGIQSEELLNDLDVKIHEYLVEIGSKDLNDQQMRTVAKYIDTIKDIERIGDHIDNLFEFFIEMKTQKIVLREETKKELDVIFDMIREQLDHSIEAFNDEDKQLAIQIDKKENELNALVKQYRQEHILDFNALTKEGYDTVYYIDIISNLERIGDHCHNIAENVLDKVFSKKAVRAK